MIDNYIKKINTRFRTGISTEHTFRGDLQNFLESFGKNVLVTNEPTRIACGAPDYIITKKNIPVGYIEAKDVGEPLAKIEKTEQIRRYLASLENLILTDYLDFRFYRSGKFVASAKIAEIRDKKIISLPEKHEDFRNLLQDFLTHTGQTITSASELARMMAGKARMMQSVLENALTSDEENEQDSSLKDQMIAFRKVLIHDINASEFADIYAQTIAYGMFAARLHDTASEDYSRQKAAELIPKTNPFLRNLFGYIAGPAIDERIEWIVEALADIFRAANLGNLRGFRNPGGLSQSNDPMIHFYETFLSEYNPKLRKSRGVWFTPEPVVKFIVRAVDDILKTEFGLAQGLADTSMAKIGIKDADGKKKTREVHKVQILDPATGTGTFLAEVIRQIHGNFKGQEGIWSNYVENHLIPRLNGFEILMAPYAMAHLKLDWVLRETGYKPKHPSRFRVFLTNSLEEFHPDTGTLFTTWLSNEAAEANFIKRDTPVMVVIGNPPYSGHSANKETKGLEKLMEDYKQEPGGGKLQEKNPKWLNDDYVKFIRYGQNLIEKNNEGLLAYISNHSFLDNPTFRGMRWHLLTAFDKIYILDLHGNSKKKEVSPDGSPDKNVFDIMQGVSINLFVKTGKKKKDKLGKVFHCDLFGERESKYDFLLKNNIKTVGFKDLELHKPYYFFVQKDFESKKEYDKGFPVNELFQVNSVGIVTGRDAFVTDTDKEQLEKRIKDFFSSDKSELEKKYGLKENKSWRIEKVKNSSKSFSHKFIQKLSYRPFDDSYLYYDPNFIERSRSEVMRHFLKGENVGLIFTRATTASKEYNHVFCIRNGIIARYFPDASCVPYFTPLYLYPDIKADSIFAEKERVPNLNMEIVQKIAEKIGLTFTPEKENVSSQRLETTINTFAPIDILDYIYAVLHSPTYRKTYEEFLKIDFPRVPYPKDSETFWKLVRLGEELRTIHLLENPIVEKYMTTYPQDGDNIITRKIAQKDYEIIDKKTGRVWINDQQYFDNVPQIVWEFYIGGYQPAQKWLKDRHGRELTFEDILHYQKIIAALTETDRIMKIIGRVSEA